MTEVTIEGTGGYTIATPTGLKCWDLGKLGDQLKMCGELEREWMCCVSNIESLTEYMTSGEPRIAIEIFHPVRLDTDLVLEMLRRQATRYKTALEIAKTSYCIITGLAKDPKAA